MPSISFDDLKSQLENGNHLGVAINPTECAKALVAESVAARASDITLKQQVKTLRGDVSALTQQIADLQRQIADLRKLMIPQK